MNIIDKLYDRLPPLVFVSREDFGRSLQGWAIEPVEIGGALAFVFLSKGPEFHFQSFGQHHRITMAMIRSRLDPILAAHGYAMTRTPKDDARQHRFNLRFGFEAIGEDEYDIFYRVERLLHG